MRIALTGNPNSGKTTMYNALTGRNEKVGNWAGVTVEKKEHPIKKSYYSGSEELIAVDLPGAYSMSPFTSEESITSMYVKNEHPDVIINIVDSTNLSRSLFFTTQLLELGIPVVVALNKSDVNEKKETKIDTATLSKKLGCPVVETVSTSADGLKEVISVAVSLIGKEQKAPYTQADIDLSDKKAVEEEDRKRFRFVNKIVSAVETRKVLTKDRNKQDKIDAVLTNKWAGIPIFIVVMFLVFQISQAWVGPWIAEGYVFERDDQISVAYNQQDILFTKAETEGEEEAETPVIGLWESESGEKLSLGEDNSFTLTVNGEEKTGTYTFEEDELALELDGAEASYDSRDVEIPGLVTLIDMFKEWVAGALEGGNVFLVALLTEGVIGGVSAVVGFLPLVMVMYFLIALLEDCGYMARVSVVLDPIFKKVGLSGKSVIPFVIGTGCAIPGVMACRTIRNERERRATAMLTPFMPCGAKLPVIALFAGAFFANASWVGTLMYFVGIIIILFGALIVNKITGNKGKKSFFIMELPEYKSPSFGRAFKSMCGRGWAYIVKAGTIILICNAVVFIMQSFDWSFSLVAEGAESTSILATVSKPIAFLLVPIGIGAWQMAAASVTGFIAKENVVGTLAVCYGISNLIDTEELAMMEGAGAEVATIFGLTKVAALAYLMFNLFTPPCFAAIGAMNSEMKSAKWLWSGIALQMGVGYSIAYLVYTVGTLITEPAKLAIVPAICGGVAVLAMVAVVVFLCIRSDKKLKTK